MFGAAQTASMSSEASEASTSPGYSSSSSNVSEAGSEARGNTHYALLVFDRPDSQLKIEGFAKNVVGLTASEFKKETGKKLVAALAAPLSKFVGPSSGSDQIVPVETVKTFGVQNPLGTFQQHQMCDSEKDPFRSALEWIFEICFNELIIAEKVGFKFLPPEKNSGDRPPSLAVRIELYCEDSDTDLTRALSQIKLFEPICSGWPPLCIG